MHKLFAIPLMAAAFGSLAHADTSSDWYYTVQHGENLWSIARTHLQSLSMVPALQQQNGIRNPYALRSGSTLRIPQSWLKQHISSATVSDLVGSAEFAGQLLKPGQRVKLIPGSEIRTSVKSSLKLILEDGSLISLGSQAALKVQNATHYPSTAANNNLLLLQQGNVENIILKNPLMPTRHDIATPSAVTAVRGTRFRVNIDQPGRSATEVASGNVGVSAADSQQQLQGGEGNVTIAGQAAGKRQPLPPPPALHTIPASHTVNPPVLDWPAVAGMTGYQITLTRLAPQRQIIDDLSSTDSHYHPQLSDGQYQLSVRSTQPDGLQGIPSELTFDLRSQPQPPVIVSPQDNARLSAREMKLHIAGIEGEQYLLQLARDASMSAPQELIITDRQQTLPLPDGGSWFWRIATLDAQARPGPFSQTQTIHSDQGFWRASRQHHLQLRGRDYPLAAANYQLRIENLSRQEPDITLQADRAHWATREPIFPGRYRLSITIKGENGYQAQEPQRLLIID